MSEKPEVWPPPPGPQNVQPLEVAVCPACKRKLLTQTSALCNWCGAMIDNPEYQARAAQSRQERDQQERAALETVIQEEAQHGVLGRLKRMNQKGKNGPKNNPLA